MPPIKKVLKPAKVVKVAKPSAKVSTARSSTEKSPEDTIESEASEVSQEQPIPSENKSKPREGIPTRFGFGGTITYSDKNRNDFHVVASVARRGETCWSNLVNLCPPLSIDCMKSLFYKHAEELSYEEYTSSPELFTWFIVTPRTDEYSKYYKKYHVCKQLQFSLDDKKTLTNNLSPVFACGGQQANEVMLVAIPSSVLSKRACIGGSKSSKDSVIRHTLMAMKQQVLSRLSGNITSSVPLPWMERFSFKSVDAVSTLFEATLPPMLLSSHELKDNCTADDVIQRLNSVMQSIPQAVLPQGVLIKSSSSSSFISNAATSIDADNRNSNQGCYINNNTSSLLNSCPSLAPTLLPAAWLPPPTATNLFPLLSGPTCFPNPSSQNFIMHPQQQMLMQYQNQQQQYNMMMMMQQQLMFHPMQYQPSPSCFSTTVPSGNNITASSGFVPSTTNFFTPPLQSSSFLPPPTATLLPLSNLPSSSSPSNAFLSHQHLLSHESNMNVNVLNEQQEEEKPASPSYDPLSSNKEDDILIPE